MEQINSNIIINDGALINIRDQVSLTQILFYLFQVNKLLFCIVSLLLTLFRTSCTFVSKSYTIFIYLMDFLYLPYLYKLILKFQHQMS